MLFKTYLSLLRSMFRKTHFLFTDTAANKIKSDIVKYLNHVDSKLEKELNDDDIYPQQLENDLEELQNTLNKRRFERGLIIPMGQGRDPTGAGGWEGTDD